MDFLGPFCFIDKVVEIRKNEFLTAVFKLKGSEEFLKDHFEGFPVMPGVLLLEALKQASERLWAASGKAGSCPFGTLQFHDSRDFCRSGEGTQ